MKKKVRVRLRPLGVEFDVERGTPLQDVLFEYGVEFPCGGNAQCEGCKVRVLEGHLQVTPEQERVLSGEELALGWRLACRSAAEEDITLELAQWEVEVLTDNTRMEVAPREGCGIAVDLGTTTIAAQLLDLSSGDVLAVRTGLNQQARFGADVMSRIDSSVAGGQGQECTSLIRRQVGEMVASLAADAHEARPLLREVVIVGNTVMHHLFSGIDVTPLSRFPFEPLDMGTKMFFPGDLGWTLPDHATVRFLPCIGGFVGSDILAGVVATNLSRSDALVGLVDLGTNGEIVLGAKGRLLCCSAAAGPAFEGARLSMGMRAATGAVSEVSLEGGRLRCRVLGNVPPKGICGSGLVDAVAAFLSKGDIHRTGRISGGADVLDVCPPVLITQADVRELQMAKAAIAAGVRILLNELGSPAEDVAALYLAGAFGNYINRSSAARIGLLGFPPEKVHPRGNTALAGAKAALLGGTQEEFSGVLEMITHVPLGSHSRFQEVFVEEMYFPAVV